MRKEQYADITNVCFSCSWTDIPSSVAFPSGHGGYDYGGGGYDQGYDGYGYDNYGGYGNEGYLFRSGQLEMEFEIFGLKNNPER